MSGNLVNDEPGSRGPVGLLATIARTAEGQVRLILDDVRVSSSDEPQTWSKETLYTYSNFPEQSFYAGSLSAEQLSAIGLAVVVRLAAHGQPSRRE